MQMLHSPILRGEQQLAMSPFLRYLVEIFQLPVLDLQNRITQEIEENPMLELDDEKNKPDKSLDEELDETIIDKVESLIEYFGDSSDIGDYSYRGENKNQEFIEGTLVKHKTLQEYLIWQLRLSVADEKDFKIGERIISNINDKGFLATDLSDISSGMGVEYHEAEAVLKLIQTFEPYGVGSRNLQESLLIQLKYYPEKNEWAERVIKNYFDLLSKGKDEEIRKKLGVSHGVIKNIFELIKKLDPYPGHQYETEHTEYVVPDVLVKKNGQDFVIIINDEWIPKVRVNKRYHNLMKNKKVNTNVRSYLRNKFNYALWFIKSLEQRNTVLYRVTSSILAHQKKFFLQGPEFISPLTLKDIAEVVNIHPSTVSRVTINKYIQTPYGIYSMKHFFSTTVKSDTEDDISSKRVKELIKDIIEKENPLKPFSDEQISEMLKENKIFVARRTVAKYRKGLKILPSHYRVKKN